MASLTQNQITSLSAGIQASMDSFQSRIETQVLAEALPLLGNGLALAATGGQAALNATQTLGEVISDALDVLSIASSQTTATVQAALEAALNTAGFTGTAIGVTVSGGTAHITLATQKFGSYAQDLVSDLAMAGLDMVTDAVGTVDATFGYALEFGSTGSTFFIDTTAASEVSLDLSLGNVSFDPSLTLDGQTFAALDAGTGFTGTIGIDLQSGSGQLSVGQMGTASLSATLDGTATLDVEVTRATQGDMTPPISATLLVDWGFSGAGIDPTDNNSGFGARPEVTFDTVTMDLGTFMGDFIGPMIEQIDTLLTPIRPILEILTASIKVLENFPSLGGLPDANNDNRVTLLDLLALKFPDIDIDPITEFADIALEVADWADFLNGTLFNDGDLVLGSFDLGTADIRTPGFDLTTTIGDFQGLTGDLNSIVGSLTGTGWTTTDPGSGMTGREILQDMLGGSVFDLPILTDPAQWMNLFMGQTADLVTVDMPEVEFTTGERTILSFPIFPAVTLDIIAEFAATFNFNFGFDTRGLLDDQLDAIDGFHLIDGPGPEIMLSTLIGLGISLNLLVLTATGQGDIEGTINLDLNSGATAGKLYFDEFIDAVTQNPFSIFDASGAITAGFSASVDSLFGEIWRWDSPRVTIGNFGFDDNDGGYNFAKQTGDTLTLNVGNRSGNRNTAIQELITTNYVNPDDETMAVTFGVQNCPPSAPMEQFSVIA